ncbi:hypothetical protein GCM10023220_51280 [Streptomyces ziwulingensis]|uniref:Uncharacterized protein n=1 Tax=Streptomyces ziwulingensis TaxID=1045501 RepID=A0ABP9CLN9_9ACTN
MRLRFARSIGPPVRVVKTGALEGTSDAGSALLEVEVFPLEAEEFALAESGAEGEFVQHEQSVIADGSEELSGFICTGRWCGVCRGRCGRPWR